MRRASINRRTFIAFAGACSAAWPLALRAQQPKKAVIGFVSWWPPEMASHLDALREGLRELGYVEGTTIEFDPTANVTLFVVNGPSPAGLGLGGQGYLSYSIATPTGEGITTPLTFTRYRRVMITGSLRMV